MLLDTTLKCERNCVLKKTHLAHCSENSVQNGPKCWKGQSELERRKRAVIGSISTNIVQPWECVSVLAADCQGSGSANAKTTSRTRSINSISVNSYTTCRSVPFTRWPQRTTEAGAVTDRYYMSTRHWPFVISRSTRTWLPGRLRNGCHTCRTA